MRTLRLAISVAALLLAACAVFADVNSSFDEGLRLYRDGNMSGAITAWEDVMRHNVVSGPLLYNLGNAYYRSGNIGKSILCYERAKKLMPRDADVRTNLDLAHLAIVDRIESPIRLIIWDWVDGVRDYLSLDELATLLQILGLAAAAAFVGWRFARVGFRAALRTTAIVLICVFAVTAAWYGWRSVLDARPFGIVMVEKTDVFSAPDSAATQLFSLHEGTKVRLGESLSGWVQVRLTDGRKGWTPIQDVDPI